MRKYRNNMLVSESRPILDGFLPLQIRGGSNGVLSEYVWGLNLGGGIGGLLDLKQGGQNYSYLYDGKGNVTALLNGSQSVVAAYTYDTFGNLMSETASLSQPFQFSTKAYDQQTGLSYFGYRFYSPVLGRWITQDPIGYAGGLNLYEFVGNGPVNWADPYGLQGIWGGLPPSMEVYEANMEGFYPLGDTLGLFGSWALGTGPEVRIFGPDTWQVENLMDAPGVNAARNHHRKKNRKRCGDDRLDTTDWGSGFGGRGFLRAGDDPAEQFVGSYDVNIYAGNGYDLFVVTNVTSMKSFLLGKGPEYKRKRFFPFGGNMTQEYWWKEPVEK